MAEDQRFIASESSNLLLSPGRTLKPREKWLRDTGGDLAAAIEVANGRQGLSKSALARLSGVPQTTISLCLRPKDRQGNATG